MKIRLRKNFKHLKQLEKQTVKVEKRIMLAKFCGFVFPEDQDY